MDYHYFPNSHWSRILSLVLAEKDLHPTPHVVDIRSNATFAPEYMRLNPRGVVPTLVDGDTVVCNGPSIARYLDEKANPRLARFEDEQVRSWSARLEDFPLMLFSYSVWVLGQKGEKSADILDDKIARAARLAEQHPELRHEYERKQRFFVAFRDEVYDGEHVARRTREGSAVLDEMGALVQGREWLCGDYSFADCIATSILYRLVDLHHLNHWHGDPNHGLDAYYRRLCARRSFRQVFVDDPSLSDPALAGG